MLSSLRSAARSSRIVTPHRGLARLNTPSRRRYASIADLKAPCSPGEQLHGFTLNRAEHVPELELSALHFTHNKTGADYLHLARDDANNAFLIGFKTNPPDATGVPHILEHTTLCGSEKYPVRDPFFKMIPRSLQNFMNAMTSTDHTMYPFATTNAQDFRNLMSVYLDSTLHPLLKRSDFVQEGWRIGPENPQESVEGKDDGSDLVFKGVVYNEMKGQMSDASYLYFIRFFEHMVPSLHNYGGDPAKMTELTYDQLKSFHQDHYHPSNSKILTYGDQPVQHHLQFLGEQLASFSKTTVDRELKAPITLDGPRAITLKGPIDPLTPIEAQYKTSLTWLIGDPRDVVEFTALSLALNVLMDGYGSPMYRALIESGLGTDFSPNTGILDTEPTAIYSIGLSGVTKENVPKVKEVITATLMETIAKGLDKNKIEGNLHQMELGLKHKSASFGLSAVQRLVGKWFNGLDPYKALAVKSTLDQFKANYAQEGYLEGLLKKYLLTDNTVTFTMEPSPDFAAELAAEEASRLKTKISETVKKYSSEQEAYKDLRQRELELVEEQDAGRTQSLDSLPTLHVSDISREEKPTKVRDSQVDNVKVQWHEAATNGLTYFRALSLFKDLPGELRMLVPLFCDSLMRIGTKHKSMEELEDLIKLKTGGISFGTHTTASPFDMHKAEEGLALSGHAFDHNIPAMFELIQTILLETDFDSPQAHGMVRELLQTAASGAVDAVASSGHSYAMRYSEAGISPQARLTEQYSGLSQVRMTANLAASEEDPVAMGEIISKLKIIQAIAVSNMRSGSMRVALTCGADTAGANEAALQKFLSATSAAGFSSPSLAASIKQPSFDSLRTLFNLPYQVSYSGLAISTGPYNSSTSAPFAILAKLLTHKHLHHEIREKGGAYGGGAYSKGIPGIFGMYSYRDPNPSNTLKIYSETGRWAAEREWSDRELEEAKLGVFQGLDAPISVNQEGMVRFLSGVDAELEQKRREWLLDVDARQVREAAEKVARAVEDGARITVLGDAEKQTFWKGEGWKVEDLGMKPVVETAA